MKTYMARPAEIRRRWFQVDAEGKVLGRLAVEVARILMGKHRPTYTPHLDTGDFVVVVNARKVEVTGKKAEKKVYYHHTGYHGGLVVTPYEKMLARKPEEVIRLAVRRMLPKTRLGRHMLTKLKVYAGGEHPHTAQQPEPLELKAASVLADVRRER
ncbi:MAG: 50S ribosomal protein L13 [Planctomycetes bacterium]|nr:50S ribosomal protein L13 [Planctomycetota bacterium]